MNDIKQEFKEEFDKTVNYVMNSFDKSEDKARTMVGIIINNYLKQIQIDAFKMPFIDFYKEYIYNPEVFKYKDFTVSQLADIIEESPMNQIDKMIAYKLFIEQKTYSEIAGECYIAEPKTISNNKDRISEILRKTAAKLYKK